MVKKIIYGVLSLVLVAAIVVGVYIFAVEKTIPAEKVSEQIAAIKATDISEAEKEPSIRFFLEDIEYTKDGNKTITTYNPKGESQIINKSTDTSEFYELKTKHYNTEGKLTEEIIEKYYTENGAYYKEDKNGKQAIENFNYITSGYDFVYSYYFDNGKLKNQTLDMIDNNLEKVTQLGSNITLHLEGDNTKIKITYNLVAKKIVKIETISDTYTADVLTERVHYYIEFI